MPRPEFPVFLQRSREKNKKTFCILPIPEIGMWERWNFAPILSFLRRRIFTYEHEK